MSESPLPLPLSSVTPAAEPTQISAPADSSVTVTPPAPVPTGFSPEAHSQAWIVSALAIVGTVVLAALGKTIPEILYVIDGATVTGAAALSFSRR